MGKLFIMDFSKPLPFDTGAWSVQDWPLNSSYRGLMNNPIGHSEKTIFSITAKWEKLTLKFITQSEYNYDYMVIESNGSQVYSTKGCSQNTPLSTELTFDGSERTLKFYYRKDSSGTTLPDAILIYEMGVQTADNSLCQSFTKYALKCADNCIYTMDENKKLIKLGDSYESITSAQWNNSTCDTIDIADIRNDITGPKPTLLKYCSDSSSNSEINLKFNCLRPPKLVKTKQSYDFSMDYIKGIDSFSVTKVMGEGDILKFMLTIDDGKSWLTWSGSTWVTVPTLTDDILLTKGMDTGTWESLKGDALTNLFSNRKLGVAFILKPGSITSELKLNKYECKYVL